MKAETVGNVADILFPVFATGIITILHLFIPLTLEPKLGNGSTPSKFRRK
jgi:hypothetical protein